MTTSFEILRDTVMSGIFAKIKMTDTAKLVLWVLASHFNNETGQCYPSQTTIAAKLGKTRETVCRAMSELKKIGLIKSTGSAGNNKTYFFTTIFYSAIITVKKAEKKTYQNDTTTYQNDTGNLYQIDTQTNKVRTKNLTKKEFFKKNSILEKKWGNYFETFQKMSEKEIETWKSLEGYNKAPYLIQKAKDYRAKEISAAENARRQAERQAERQPDPFTNRDFAIKTIKDSGINAFTVNLIKRHQISDAEIAA
jgi:DNA-binding MarR family transcriptional regulator